MRLKLHAEKKRNEDVEYFKKIMQRTISERFGDSRIQRFNESIKSIILFPFEFIIVCLYILMLPFIIIAGLLGIKFALRGVSE